MPVSNALKKYAPFLIFAAAVMLFFAETLTLSTGFYSGDHRQQHYPWAFFYSAALAHGQLPWWTSLFATGFPLLAEGQVGALYIVNWVFYKFLPFDVAYSYGILFHFFIAACFFYLFVREIGVKTEAAILGTLIYLFGTAEGGYYYNIISLKTLVWFPLALFLIEKFFKKNRPGYLGFLAVIYAFQFTAGYLQYAVYSVLFSSVYFLIRLFKDGQGPRRAPFVLKNLFSYGLVLLASGLMALPQLGSTWELAKLSNRYYYPVDFAFLGSVNPLALWTLFFPHWDGVLKAELYFSALGLFFLIHAILTKKSWHEKVILALLVLSLLLALGKYNPLYYYLIKWTGFGSFRTPSKFLYFAGCFGAVLCSFGIGKLPSPEARRSWTLWGVLTALAILLLPLIRHCLLWFEKPIKGIALEYVRSHYIGSAIHPHSFEVYTGKVHGFFTAALRISEPCEPFNLIFILFMLVTLLVVRRLFLGERNWKQRYYWAAGILIFANLYAYGFTTVKGNLEPRSFLRPGSPIIAAIKNDPVQGRLHRFYSDLPSADALPIMPHNNMLYGMPVLGGYSPLLPKDYFDLMAGLGDVNDSQRAVLPDLQALRAQKPLLDFLSVRWLLSSRKLDLPAWTTFEEAPDHVLLLNSRALPRAFYVSRAVSRSRAEFNSALKRGEPDLGREVYLEDPTLQNLRNHALFKEAVVTEDSGDRVALSLSAPAAGFLVMSDLFYPGWKAVINGISTPIYRANGCFRAILIPRAGSYRVDFSFQPLWRTVLPYSLVFFAGIFLLSIYDIKRGRSNEHS